MEVLILGICHEIFFFGKKRSKIRVRIIHRRALYTGKYGIGLDKTKTKWCDRERIGTLLFLASFLVAAIM